MKSGTTPELGCSAGQGSSFPLRPARRRDKPMRGVTTPKQLTLRATSLSHSQTHVFVTTRTDGLHRPYRSKATPLAIDKEGWAEATVGSLRVVLATLEGSRVTPKMAAGDACTRCVPKVGFGRAGQASELADAILASDEGSPHLMVVDFRELSRSHRATIRRGAQALCERDLLTATVLADTLGLQHLTAPTADQGACQWRTNRYQVFWRKP